MLGNACQPLRPRGSPAWADYSATPYKHAGMPRAPAYPAGAGQLLQGIRPLLSDPWRRKLNVVAAYLSVFVPWLLFLATYAALSFRLHFEYKVLCQVLVAALFAVPLLFGALVALATLGGSDSSGGRHGHPQLTWHLFLFFTTALAWFAGGLLGERNFVRNMQPYYGVLTLGTYDSVDPMTTPGELLMDGGRVQFASNTIVDTKRAVGFQNEAIYCVAPIVRGDAPPTIGYDFWAVGVDCCSGEQGNFSCGSTNSSVSRGGVRLLEDHQRPFFRLAVQQAQSAFNIKAVHPLFYYWVEDPDAEVDGRRDEGYKQFIIAVLCSFGVQTILVAAAMWLFTALPR